MKLSLHSIYVPLQSVSRPLCVSHSALNVVKINSFYREDLINTRQVSDNKHSYVLTVCTRQDSILTCMQRLLKEWKIRFLNFFFFRSQNNTAAYFKTFSI